MPEVSYKQKSRVTVSWTDSNLNPDTLTKVLRYYLVHKLFVFAIHLFYTVKHFELRVPISVFVFKITRVNPTSLFIRIPLRTRQIHFRQ